MYCLTSNAKTPYLKYGFYFKIYFSQNKAFKPCDCITNENKTLNGYIENYLFFS